MLVTLVYVSFLKENFDSQAFFSILMKVVNGATRVLYMQSGDSGSSNLPYYMYWAVLFKLATGKLPYPGDFNH